MDFDNGSLGGIRIPSEQRVVLVLVPHIYMLLYLSGTLAFSAIVDLLRAKEAKTIQSPWKMKALLF